MSRSLKKGPFVHESILKKIQIRSKNEVIKTWSRVSMIIPDMVGFTFAVHNGKEHIPVKVVEEMIGHRLGEFSPTRKFRRHGGKMAREQESSGAKSTSAK